MEGKTINGDCEQATEVHNSSNSILKPIERDSSINSINKLQELLQKQKRQLPVYTFLSFLDKGLFPTFTCIAKVDGHSTQADAKTKKEAKLAAAEKLLQSLQDSELISMGTTDTSHIEVKYIEIDQHTNPIGKLHELMQQKKREMPVYTFTSSWSDGDIPRFRCELTLDNQSTYGEGKSKKEAKCAAAVKFLQSLNDAEVNSRDTNSTLTPPHRLNCIEGVASINPIARLQELIQQQGYPLPDYSFVNCHPDGFATFRCIVTAKSMSACAKGNSKKEAKYAAAEKMLQALQTDKTDSMDTTDTPDLKVNYIGNLLMFCQDSRKQSPKYEVHQTDDIPPSFEVTISIGDVVSVAKATRKKDAMQLAAKELLNKLLLIT